VTILFNGVGRLVAWCAYFMLLLFIQI